MTKMYFVLLAVLASVLAVGVSTASPTVFGTAVIHAPAVLLNNNTGTLTQIGIIVTGGSGNVIIKGPIGVGNSTNESANIAAAYAASLEGDDFYNYNFTYYISDNTSNVSGPSAGAAMTMLAVAALTRRNLVNNFTMTGTINPDGTIGQVGGVYDKAQAAKSGGMSFILVPGAGNGSLESLIYFVAQRVIGIPLVQVYNITQAERYAFSYQNVSTDKMSYNLSVDYNVNNIPNASLACSNRCNMSPLMNLQNFTYAFTENAASALTSDHYLSDLGNETLFNNAQALQLASKGYTYMAADIEFVGYINAFMLLNHGITINEGHLIVNNTSKYCAGTVPAEMTNANYEYIMAAGLRNGLGAYTINAVESAEWNQLDTDTLMELMQSNAEAHAWCSAAQFMYNQSSMMGGQPSKYGPNVASMAERRMARASNDTGLYLSVANTLYANKQYGAAIISADYAYVLNNPNIYGNLSNSTIRQRTLSMAKNSTYGAWATQFSNVAMFFMNESEMYPNTTIGDSYMLQAYQYALLASQVSNDTLNIYEDLVPTTSSTTVPTSASTTIPQYVLVPKGSAMEGSAILIAVVSFIISIVAAIIASLTYAKVVASRKPKRINRRRRKR